MFCLYYFHMKYMDHNILVFNFYKLLYYTREGKIIEVSNDPSKHGWETLQCFPTTL